jgi:hypothetical protein
MSTKLTIKNICDNPELLLKIKYLDLIKILDFKTLKDEYFTIFQYCKKNELLSQSDLYDIMQKNKEFSYVLFICGYNIFDIVYSKASNISIKIYCDYLILNFEKFKEYVDIKLYHYIYGKSVYEKLIKFLVEKNYHSCDYCISIIYSEEIQKKILSKGTFCEFYKMSNHNFASVLKNYFNNKYLGTKYIFQKNVQYKNDDALIYKTFTPDYDDIIYAAKNDYFLSFEQIKNLKIKFDYNLLELYCIKKNIQKFVDYYNLVVDTSILERICLGYNYENVEFVINEKNIIPNKKCLTNLLEQGEKYFEYRCILKLLLNYIKMTDIELLALLHNFEKKSVIELLEKALKNKNKKFVLNLPDKYNELEKTCCKNNLINIKEKASNFLISYQCIYNACKFHGNLTIIKWLTKKFDNIDIICVEFLLSQISKDIILSNEVSKIPIEYKYLKKIKNETIIKSNKEIEIKNPKKDIFIPEKKDIDYNKSVDNIEKFKNIINIKTNINFISFRKLFIKYLIKNKNYENNYIIIDNNINKLIETNHKYINLHDLDQVLFNIYMI